jgi:hypothetical protein
MPTVKPDGRCWHFRNQSVRPTAAPRHTHHSLRYVVQLERPRMLLRPAYPSRPSKLPSSYQRHLHPPLYFLPLQMRLCLPRRPSQLRTRRTQSCELGLYSMSSAAADFWGQASTRWISGARRPLYGTLYAQSLRDGGTRAIIRSVPNDGSDARDVGTWALYPTKCAFLMRFYDADPLDEPV